MAVIFESNLRKMKHEISEDNSVNYFIDVEPINQYIGKKIKLEYLDSINCVACNRQTNKSFSGGYCFPCMQSLAECDTCIIKPELCHFDNGTCRDEEFANSHCNISHTLYISLTSSMKIGVTRQVQEKTRWVDQGAVKALRLLTLKRRWHAGLLEVEIAKSMADKTNWRRMLKNEVDEKDLEGERAGILEQIKSLIEAEIIEEDLCYVLDEELKKPSASVQEIKYPVLEYPEKIKSHNFDKNPLVEGELLGIKGQYLILDTGVINLRKFAGYKVRVNV